MHCGRVAPHGPPAPYDSPLSLHLTPHPPNTHPLRWAPGLEVLSYSGPQEARALIRK